MGIATTTATTTPVHAFSVAPPSKKRKNILLPSPHCSPISPIEDIIEVINSICNNNKEEAVAKLKMCKENNEKVRMVVIIAADTTICFCCSSPWGLLNGTHTDESKPTVTHIPLRRFPPCAVFQRAEDNPG